MRLLVDSLIALMLVAILAGVLMIHQQRQRELQVYQSVHTALARLHEMALYQAILQQVETSLDRPEEPQHRHFRFPRQIDPAWFADERLPVNMLVSDQQAWLDVAPAGDMADHPPDPVIEHDQQAGFWYNPNRGIFRARVTQQSSTNKTLESYNKANGAYLAVLPIDDAADRQPLPVPWNSALAQKLEQARQFRTTQQAVSSTTRTNFQEATTPTATKPSDTSLPRLHTTESDNSKNQATQPMDRDVDEKDGKHAPKRRSLPPLPPLRQ